MRFMSYASAVAGTAVGYTPVQPLSIGPTAATFAVDVIVPDKVYGGGWSGDLSAPTRNAVYNKIQTIIGLSDGDKGDITVSVSGTVWTIDNDAVTYAKIQNVSATDRILGRSTAGAGDVEEIACTAAGRTLIADINSAAQRTTLGLGGASNVTFGNLTAADIKATSALQVLCSTAGNFYLKLISGGTALTADRTLTIAVGNTSRTLTFTGDATISGTNTGDQTTIVGITGTLSDFNTALTGADFATGGGTVTGASSGTNTGDQSIFSTIAVSGQSNVVADSTTDTLTFAAGDGIDITTDAGSDTVTITSEVTLGKVMAAVRNIRMM